MSSQLLEKDVNLKAITEGNSAGADSKIENSEPLIDFANAIVSTDTTKIESARNALVEAMGESAMIEAAGVASNFQRMVRIADSTGIPLGRFEEMSVDIRDALKLNDFLKQKNH